MGPLKQNTMQEFPPLQQETLGLVHWEIRPQQHILGWPSLMNQESGNQSTATRYLGIGQAGNQSTATGNRGIAHSGNLSTATRNIAIVKLGNMSTATGKLGSACFGNRSNATKNLGIAYSGKQSTADGNLEIATVSAYWIREIAHSGNRLTPTEHLGFESEHAQLHGFCKVDLRLYFRIHFNLIITRLNIVRLISIVYINHYSKQEILFSM